MHRPIVLGFAIGFYVAAARMGVESTIQIVQPDISRTGMRHNRAAGLLMQRDIATAGLSVERAGDARSIDSSTARVGAYRAFGAVDADVTGAGADADLVAEVLGSHIARPGVHLDWTVHTFNRHIARARF